MRFIKQVARWNGWNIAIANLHTFHIDQQKNKQLGPNNDRVQVWTTICCPRVFFLNFIVPVPSNISKHIEKGGFNSHHSHPYCIFGDWDRPMLNMTIVQSSNSSSLVVYTFYTHDAMVKPPFGKHTQTLDGNSTSPRKKNTILSIQFFFLCMFSSKIPNPQG